MVREKIAAGAARKPNSVPPAGYPASGGDDHSSGMPVTRHLEQPTRELGRAALKHSPIWSCTGWGLPSFSGHPENWCALTAPFHPYLTSTACLAVCFLLHLPSRRRDSTLWSTLPCGVRTFLQPCPKKAEPAIVWSTPTAIVFLSLSSRGFGGSADNSAVHRSATDR